MRSLYPVLDIESDQVHADGRKGKSPPGAPGAAHSDAARTPGRSRCRQVATGRLVLRG